MKKIEVKEYKVFKYVWECPKCLSEYRKTNVFSQTTLICRKCKTKIHRDSTENQLWRIYRREK